VGLWEILINVQSGKLNLPRPAGPYVLKKLAENGIEMLSISVDHLLALDRLPMHHRDPFDRMLICQSLREKVPIITSDPMFRRYPVDIIW
jgi:PIN domain nuclease of toxin-antitoxin system